MKTPDIPQLPTMRPVTNTAAAVAQVQAGIRQAWVERDRISQVEGGLWRHDFYIPQPTPGEATIAVTFGVTFVERPSISSSFEMAPNQKLTPGKFPIVSAGVYTWKYSFRSDWGGRLIIGATIVLVSAGATNLSIEHHVSFTGKAMSNVGQ